MKRIATAIWNGTIKEGKGVLNSKSNILNNLPYTWNSRFSEGYGTNPEELIAAAHAGCFSMALSSELGKVGYNPERIETQSAINFENGILTHSHLTVKAKVPGITKEVIEKCAREAKVNCPVSKVLNLNITMEISLI
ncbi:MAG: OsmC family protein [Bacteroidota bacterium]|nr:OsmC family protein [Bacteroidota bacterium]